jgi:hypothetical protein
MKNLFFILLLLTANLCHSVPSPLGTGFDYGTKEDLEIRLAWAKKDACFDPKFDQNSLQAMELRKYRAIQAGPNGKKVVCDKKK